MGSKVKEFYLKYNEGLYMDLNTLLNSYGSWDKNNYTGRKCKKCDGDIVVLGKQTRSADEGMTMFYVCSNCNDTKKI